MEYYLIKTELLSHEGVINWIDGKLINDLLQIILIMKIFANFCLLNIFKQRRAEIYRFDKKVLLLALSVYPLLGSVEKKLKN